jgi:hypothetical protein
LLLDERKGNKKNFGVLLSLEFYCQQPMAITSGLSFRSSIDSGKIFSFSNV